MSPAEQMAASMQRLADAFGAYQVVVLDATAMLNDPLGPIARIARTFTVQALCRCLSG